MSVCSDTIDCMCYAYYVSVCAVHVFIGGMYVTTVRRWSPVYGHVAGAHSDKKNKNFWTFKWGVGIMGKISVWNENRILPRQLFDQIFFQNLKIIKTNPLNNSRKNKKEEKISFLFFKYLHDLYNHRFSIKFYFFFFLLSKPIYLP